MKLAAYTIKPEVNDIYRPIRVIRYSPYQPIFSHHLNVNTMYNKQR